MQKISDKLDIIIDKINDIEKVQIVQEGNLKEHMRRTEILEEEIKPIVTHVAVVKSSFKILIAVIGILGTLLGLYKGFR